MVEDSGSKKQLVDHILTNIRLDDYLFIELELFYEKKSIMTVQTQFGADFTTICRYSSTSGPKTTTQLGTR